ncbi:hypothetical protein EP47_13610, partial [Legionella norrlandica]
MQAQEFYKTRGDRVVPIYFISQIQWEEGIENLTSVERNYFSIRQFKGKLGDYCFILNADGVIEKAYIGSGTGNQESALANAALSLPPGNYQLQEKLALQVAVSWGLAQYRFDKYKKYELQPRILIVGTNEIDHILNLTNSLFLVRDLINKPSCDM